MRATAATFTASPATGFKTERLEKKAFALGIFKMSSVCTMRSMTSGRPRILRPEDAARSQDNDIAAEVKKAPREASAPVFSLEL